MSEVFLTAIEGLRGSAEVYQMLSGLSSQTVRWEVQWRGNRYPCSSQGEAVILAMELVRGHWQEAPRQNAVL